MNESLQLDTEPIQKSVKVRQNIAAWLLVLTNVYWLFCNVTRFNPLTGISQPVVIGLVCIVAWGLLYSTASNKATRIATMIGIVLLFITMIINTVATIKPFYFSHSMMYIIPILWIYIYSTILIANKNISSDDKTWLIVLIVYKIFNLSIFIFSAVIYRLTNMAHGFYWVWLVVLFNILCTIAEFRFAKCTAFSGNYNPEPVAKGTFSPLNKYFVATLVAIVFISGLIYLLYSNVETIESIL